MSIFRLFENWNDAKTNNENKRDLITEMTEKLQRNLQQDFPEQLEKGGTLANFCTALKSAIQKHVESQHAPAAEGGEASTSHPVNVRAFYHTAPDGMEAYACLLPPLNDGENIEEVRFLEDMRYEGIVAGVDGAAIVQMIEDEEYLRIRRIAKGLPPVDGTDGRIEELLARRSETALDLSADDSLQELDFREKNAIQAIQKGDAICRIHPPVNAVNGTDVFGRAIPAEGGEAPEIPQGKHTVLSQDGALLLAEISGILVTDGHLFTVRPLQIVDTLNANTGGLEYAGDIFIRGSVEGGITVKAGGNIIVDGDVTHGTLISDGTIRIQGEVKGAPQVYLQAARQIQCMIMENASATAVGDIFGEVIANCHLTSETGSVYALLGRGLLFGGEIKAADSIIAKKIGNKSGCTNCLTAGYLPHLTEQREEKRQELASIQETLEKLRKSVSAMQSSGASTQRSKQEHFAKLLEQRNLYERLSKTRALELKELEKEIRSQESGCIKSEELYPTTCVQIGSHSMEVQKEAANCHLSLYAGRIQMKSSGSIAG